MGSQVQQATDVRPDFVLPAAAAGGASGAVFQFFGPTVISGPLAAGNQTIVQGGGDGRQEHAYLFAVGNVYSRWRNQYKLGAASPAASPFIPPDTALLLGRSGDDPARAGRRPLDLPTALDRYGRVLLLGGPGAGKTSCLQYLALDQAARPAETAYLPVLVDLNAWDDSGPFLDFVQAFLRNPPNPAPPEPPVHISNPWLADNLDSYLRAGRVLLLLDGLNELPSSPEAAVPARRAALQRFFLTYAGARVVIACRLLDYGGDLDAPALGFQPLLLDPWRLDQMLTYAEGRGNPALLSRLRAADPLILSLGQVPYLLYMIAEVFDNAPADPALPDPLASGSALFGRFVEQLLDWATTRDEADALLFPRAAVRAALARLAAAMQAAGYRGSAVAHQWAVDHLDAAELFGGLPAPGNLRRDPRDHLLDFSCAATILDTPATRATVRFWHLTHQDYFQALAAVPPSGGALLGANDEVNSLAAALAPDPHAAISALLQSGDPRASLVAARALITAGVG